MRLEMHVYSAPMKMKDNTAQSTSRHLNVVRKALSHHLSLDQLSSRLGLSLLLGLDDVDDTIVGSAARSMAGGCVAPSGGALDLGHLWWLWGFDTTDHREGVLERPADDHRPEAFGGEVVVHLLDGVGHVQRVFARAFGAGVLGDVSWPYTDDSRREHFMILDLQCTRRVSVCRARDRSCTRC